METQGTLRKNLWSRVWVVPLAKPLTPGFGSGRAIETRGSGEPDSGLSLSPSAPPPTLSL